ncbi:MAG: protein kinase [Candidatus Acidiferrum sp.]|jgi:eukaryotic-like serine/threonine-protein kinase
MLDQTISHYRITQKLGAGGMGVVYKAVDLKLERTVALKFLPQEMVVSDVDKERLLREARSASALDHPNIGVIHGIEESDDHQLFIVMAYYEGDTLAQRLNSGVLSLRESLDLAIQIARGLSAAHERNIVHRDIKPSNIIITKDNVAKIVDFGLARVVASASATQSISLTGTLPYMAPEQILGEPIDQRSDVWALGVILVQMITGSHPFVRPNTAAMTFAILNQPPAALDVVPEVARPMIYQTLSKKSAHRQANAGELLKDLESARAQLTSTPSPLEEPTATRSLSPRELKKIVENASTPRWDQRPARWLTRAALVALVLLIILGGILFLQPVREQLAGLVYASTEKHIAVLPFESVGNDADFNLVAGGFSDSLTNELSNLDAAQKSLWVVPASEVRSHKIADAPSAYRILGATMVVQGNVQRRGQAVYATAVLIDAKRLRQIGSVQVQNDAGDLAALENDAVTHLARLMKIRVSEGTLVRTGSAPPDSYESYLKALGYMQRYDKPGNIDLAISTLNAALQKNSGFALGYATLGEAYRLKFQMDHHPAWIAEATASCEKAIQIDDRLPAAHVTLGRLNATLGKDDIALREFQKALDIDPRNADALIGMGTVSEHAGRITDAEATYKRAISLRPDYWDGYNVLADFYDRQKRTQDSIAQYQRILELTPDNPSAYNDLGVVYMEMPDPKSAAAAEAAFRKSLQLAPNYQAYANLGWLYIGQKRYAEGAVATQKALDLNDKDWRVWANLLLAYTWLNDKEKIRAVRPRTISSLEQYALLDSKEASVQSMLSTFYGEDKLREKTISHANAALALAPKDPAILADVAEAYDYLGERRRAIQYAEDSLKQGYTVDDLKERPALLPLLADPNFHSHGR